MLSSATMQTKRISSWFSVLESNNVKYTGMGNSFSYLYAKNYQHRTWFDRVIEKLKRLQFFASRGILMSDRIARFLHVSVQRKVDLFCSILITVISVLMQVYFLQSSTLCRVKRLTISCATSAKIHNQKCFFFRNTSGTDL